MAELRQMLNEWDFIGVFDPEINTDEYDCMIREVYDAGRVLCYSPGHDEDRYGELGEGRLYDSGEDWSRFEIAEAEFQRTWTSDAE